MCYICSVTEFVAQQLGQTLIFMKVIFKDVKTMQPRHKIFSARFISR